MNTGKWTPDEHSTFLKGIELYGDNWEKVRKLIPTRTICQVRTHAQKYYAKLEKDRRKAELFGRNNPKANNGERVLRPPKNVDYVALNGDTSDADEEIHPTPHPRHPTKSKSKSKTTAPITLNPNTTSPVQVIQPQPQLVPTAVGGMYSYGTGPGVYPTVPHNGALSVYPVQHTIPAPYTAQESSNKGGYYIECATSHSQADLVMQAIPVMSAQGLPQSVVPGASVPYQQPFQTVPSSAYPTPITMIGLPPSSATTVPGMPQSVIFSQSPAVFPYPPSMGMHPMIPPTMQPGMQPLAAVGGKIPESVATEIPARSGLVQQPTTIPAASGMVPVVKMEAVTTTSPPSHSVLPSSPSSTQPPPPPPTTTTTTTTTKEEEEEEEEVSLEIKAEIKPEPTMSVPVVAKVVSPSSTIPQQPLPMSGTGSGIQTSHQSVGYNASSPSEKSVSSPSLSSPASSSTSGTNFNRIPPNQSTPIPLGSIMSSTPISAIPTACTIPVYPMNCMTSAQPMTSSPMLTMSMMSSPNGTVQYTSVPYPPTYSSSK